MRIMLIPGNGGADVNTEIWYPWLTKQLRDLGFNIISKNMPDAVLARKEYWLPFIEKGLDGDENSIIIGHSSGAVAALRYAETHKLKGIVLVSACHTDLGIKEEKESGYFDDVWNWNKIKQNVKWILQFHSLDDPFIPIKEARQIAKELKTEYVEFTNRGHFSYKNEFPELFEAIRKKLGEK